MRLTVDINNNTLDELAHVTGINKMSPAIAYAVEEFVRRQKLKELGRMLREGELADAFEPGYDPDIPDIVRNRVLNERPRAEEPSYMMLNEPKPGEEVFVPHAAGGTYGKTKKRKHGSR